MNVSPAPHLRQAMDYAIRTAKDPNVEEMQQLAARRFLKDLESNTWDFRPALPEFVIRIITGLFCFAQGERMDGTPLRGEPMELMPWHVFCIYNVCGFYLKRTQIRRFTEAVIGNQQCGISTSTSSVGVQFGHFAFAAGISPAMQAAVRSCSLERSAPPNHAGTSFASSSWLQL